MRPEEFYADARLDTGDGFGSTAGGRLNPHRGIDVQHPEGTPIPALTAGIVGICEWHDGLGWIVEVNDVHGESVGYRHLKSEGLEVGTRVAAGDRLGYVGNTGTWSAGAHTCFTVASAPGGIYGDPDLVRDPVPYIKAHRTTPKPASPPTPKPASPPTPTINEEDEEMTPVFVQNKADSGAPIFMINSLGKKRPMSKSEWDARRAGYAAAGVTVGVGKVSLDTLNRIPSA